MKKQIDKGLRNRLIYLEKDEMSDPCKVVGLFFDACSLPEHLDMLRKWRDDVAFETKGTKRRSPDNMLYDFELTVRLIEAAWLLKDCKIGKLDIGSKDNNVAEWFTGKERKKLIHYPEKLSMREKVKPSMVLKDLFRPYNVTEYRKILYSWLYDALGDNFLEENRSKYEVITVYEQLVKLFEAMWLINQRFLG